METQQDLGDKCMRNGGKMFKTEVEIGTKIEKGCSLGPGKCYCSVLVYDLTLCGYNPEHTYIFPRIPTAHLPLI